MVVYPNSGIGRKLPGVIKFAQLKLVGTCACQWNICCALHCPPRQAVAGGWTQAISGWRIVWKPQQVHVGLVRLPVWGSRDSSRRCLKEVMTASLGFLRAKNLLSRMVIQLSPFSIWFFKQGTVRYRPKPEHYTRPIATGSKPAVKSQPYAQDRLFGVIIPLRST